jgi:3-oxoacyl-[acyl-carrier-protein] synthase II
VVTGTGVLTSLGAGKQDNWRELTAGHSGIRRISRFPIGGLRTNIAGTVDFVPVDEQSAPALSERLAGLVIDEAIAEAAIGAPGEFPDQCSWHCRRWRWSTQRLRPLPPPAPRDSRL